MYLGKVNTWKVHPGSKLKGLVIFSHHMRMFNLFKSPANYNCWFFIKVWVFTIGGIINLEALTKGKVIIAVNQQWVLQRNREILKINIEVFSLNKREVYYK